MAVSKPAQTPNGYLSGNVAREACENAGKRLCTRDEWVHACRGAANRPFPYGDDYKPFACNVFRSTHPSGALHDDVTRGHLDPRLNLVVDKQGPLLRLTGATKTCKSEWGRDALFDMVGNLDEWIDDEDGVFVGGFFSRGKKDGCASVVKNHPTYYFDYSLGVRCCSFPERRR
jgi:formylglycine-generating enzyme required for sulfatase activity